MLKKEDEMTKRMKIIQAGEHCPSAFKYDFILNFNS